jgi:hypothetical protein
VVGCSFEAPEAPTFDTQIVVPISEQRFSIAELLEDIDGIEIDSTDIRISLAGELDEVTVDDELSLSMEGTSFSSELGTFELNDGLGADVGFTFGELAPGVPPGDTVVPPFAFSLPQRDASSIDDFSQVTFASGELRISITNGLPVPISGACSPNLAIVVSDGTTDYQWQVTLPIAPGETLVLTQDLAGETLGNSFSVALDGCSPGSGGSTVTVDPADELQVSVSFENVTAESATARVPSQSFGTTDVSSWEGDLRLRRAEVTSGGAVISLVNATPLTASITVRFPDFRESGGDTLGFDLPMPPSSNQDVTLDFAGVRFESPLPVTETSYVVRVVTEDTGDAEVALTSTDAVDVTVGDLDLEFLWVEGIPDALEEEIGPFTESLEWPDETEGFRPAVATLRLTIANGFGAAVSGDLVVEAFGDEETDSLVTPVTIAAGTADAPVTTEVILDETNSRITDLLGIYPDSIQVSGRFEIGDGTSVIRLEAGATLDGSYTVSAPFAFVVDGATVELDPYAIELDDDLQDMLRDHVAQATITVRLTNGFPFGANTSLVFDPDSTVLFTDPELELVAVRATAAEVDEVTGKAKTAATSATVVTLTQEDIETLAAPEIYLGVVVDLLPSDGVIVVSPENEVVVTSYLTIDLIVSPDLLEDDDENP